METPRGVHFTRSFIFRVEKLNTHVINIHYKIQFDKKVSQVMMHINFTFRCLSRSTKGFAKISEGTEKTLMNRS